MIGLDLDLSYLTRHYQIGSNALELYKNMSITQIMETEAEKGNPAAAEFLIGITSNPEELNKLFQLIEPKNRFLILQNMNRDDLLNVMQFLDPKEMLLGLSIFNQDVLVELMKLLDPEVMATVVLEKMDPQKFMSLLPEDYLNEFLSSDKINRQMMMKSLEEIDEAQLQKMMEHYTGQSCYDNRDDILGQMSSMSDDNFMRCIYSAEPKGKQQMISGLIREKPELFEEFSPEAMTHPFKAMPKEEILKSMNVLETKDMMPMVEQLPQDIMALIATQISPEVFSQILCNDFKDVIAHCGMNLG